MAGGQGERFWPKSRKHLPKQFLSFVDNGKSMIQLTVDRLLPIVDMDDIFIVTNVNYYDLVKEQLPKLPIENILLEPMAKNTAAAIGFAAAIIGKKYKDAIMMVLASDHLIKNEQLFLDTLTLASDIAENGENLLTMGITPIYPETGYGYIHFVQDDKKYKNAYKVEKFVEKPNLEKAKEYLNDGAYLWNSGMFVWTISTIMKQFEKLMPDMYKGLIDIQNAFGTPKYQDVLTDSFNSFEKKSIDYAIMEHAEHIYTIPGNFGWDDVGSWLSISRINKTNEMGNYVQGQAITIDTNNTTIIGGKRMIATIGLEDIIVVDTGDAILICDKNKTQEIKKVIEHLKISNNDDLL